MNLESVESESDLRELNKKIKENYITGHKT